MRSDLTARFIIGATSLTLLVSSAAVAQIDLAPPPDVPDLATSVITSSLDDAATNRLIEASARAFHLEAGGNISNNKKNGWFPQDPLPSAERITETLLDVVQDQPDVVVISGGDPLADVGVARNFPDTHVIDLGQAAPCVTEDGKPDPSGTCAGGVDRIPFNYTAVDFAVEDGAYLAGLLAAQASRNDRLGIISGASDCGECNRYVHGFVNGARSVKPQIAISLAYLATDEADGFGDAASAREFTEVFIDVRQPDVLLPIGRGATMSMVEAACDAGSVLTVGTGIDIAAADPVLAECILASITKDLAAAVTETTYAFARGEADTVVTYDLVDDRIAVTWPRQTLPVGTIEIFDSTKTGILTGQIETCPDDCSAPFGAPAQDGDAAVVPADSTP